MGELTGAAAQGRIALAAALTLAEIEARFSSRIENRDEIAFDESTGSLRGRRLRRLGAVTLAAPSLKPPVQRLLVYETPSLWDGTSFTR